MFLNIPKKEKDSLYNSQIGQQWIIIIPQKSMIMNSLILPKFIPHVNVVWLEVCQNIFAQIWRHNSAASWEDFKAAIVYEEFWFLSSHKEISLYWRKAKEWGGFWYKLETINSNSLQITDFGTNPKHQHL